MKSIFVQVDQISVTRKVEDGTAVYRFFHVGTPSGPIFDLNADDYSSLVAAIKAMTIACGEDE